LDSAVLCLNELDRGELVPLAPTYPVIAFDAYWVVCPPRHLNRRIVKRFVDWVSAEARATEARTRALLEKAGCTFRTGTGYELTEVSASSL
jgi:LysR family transcriptional regulator, glycine cleavage system transcriptional activator